MCNLYITTIWITFREYRKERQIEMKLQHRMTGFQNNKILYYVKAFLRQLMPGALFRSKLPRKLRTVNRFDKEYLRKRVNYYNRIANNRALGAPAIPLHDFKVPKKQRVYYFDTFEFTRYFSPNLIASFLFGDITHVPEQPSIVKSRPIQGDNSNSVILKLNKVRHFKFIHDPKKFEEKKSILVGRSVVKVPHRVRFYEKYFDHPLCDLGQINTNKNPQWIKDRLTITQHLDYKFILCLEGYDVATNLKWVMSSNSVAVMPKPKFETWFMEGTLIPNYHYIEIKDDYSDLEIRLKHFIENPGEALKIIAHAQEYIQQFLNEDQEELISLLVLEKYFYRTGQRAPADASLYN